MTESIKYIQHVNSWYWGNTITLIQNDGLAMIQISFDDDYPNAIILSNLIVHESIREKGCASKLMNEAINIAKIHHKIFAYLTVQANNIWVINWYKSIGFEIFSKDKDADTYTMIMRL